MACLPPLTSCFSPHSFLSFTLSSLQLYHVIWMNLHRDSPIWRRQGFRKCLKMTQQQQTVSCLWELHWDILDLSAVLVSKPDGGLTLNPDMTTQILISSCFFVFCFVCFFGKPFLCILFSFLLLVVLHFYSVFP